jgi:hypothetical protein
MLSLVIYAEDSGSPDGYTGCKIHLAPMLGAWKTATGQDYFSNMGFFRNMPYYMVAKSLPSNPTGEPALHHYLAGSQGFGLYSCMATGYLRDADPRAASLARWWTDQGYGFERACMRGGAEDALFGGLLLGDSRVPGKSPRELGLPTASVFGGGTSAVYARSGWDDPDATLIGFSNARFPSMRTGSSVNLFTLWKNRAPLLLYRGTLAFHFYVGKGRPLGNGPVMYRGEQYVESTRFGGSRAPGGSQAVGREVGTPVALVSEPGAFDFMRSDRRAFDGVSKCERTIVYLHPAGPGGQDHMVMLDRFAVEDAAITPHVVFQAVFEPKVGKDWGGTEPGAAVRDGQWRFEKAPCVTVTHEWKAAGSHGRAFLKVLHPANVAILKVGGGKHFADTLDGKLATEGPYSGFAKSDEAKQVAEGGHWRFHIVPQDKSAAHAVLSVIEPTDSKQEKPSGPMALLEGPNALGAQAGQNLVVLSKDGKAPPGPVKAPEAGKFRIVVGDLKPEAKCRLSAGGRTLELQSSRAGTVFAKDVELKAGDSITVGQ